MAGVVGQEAHYMEPDGVGAVGQGGPNGKEGGDGRVHVGLMAVAGGIGVAWDRSSRWWADRGQIRKDGGGRALG